MKKTTKPNPSDELKGFEEFIDSEGGEVSFLPKNALKKETSFEHFTFLINDGERLVKIKNLFMTKIPFLHQFDQGSRLIENQLKRSIMLKKAIIKETEKENSAYQKSLGKIFNSYYSKE